MPFDAAPPAHSIEDIRAAIHGLLAVENYLECGDRWLRRFAQDEQGRACLLGAVVIVMPRSNQHSVRKLAREYLAKASHIGTPPARINEFTARRQVAEMNDNCRDYRDVELRLHKALDLAFLDFMREDLDKAVPAKLSL